MRPSPSSKTISNNEEDTYMVSFSSHSLFRLSDEPSHQ